MNDELLPFDDDSYDDEDEDYAAMPAWGTCDGSGCLIMYDVASTLDHCAEEGTCWPHCTDAITHSLMQGTSYSEIAMFMGGGVPTPQQAELAQEYKPILMGDPKALVTTMTTKASKLDVSAAVGLLNEALNSGQPSAVFEAQASLLSQMESGAYNPTQSERVALYVAGLEAAARSEHGTVVAMSEGRSLQSHQADYGNDCGVCEMLSKYMSSALDILRPLADEEVAVMKQVQQKNTYALMGLCVDCGKPPLDGRTYTLDDEGFMCANCAGPFLLMDDGKPGNEWTQQEVS